MDSSLLLINKKYNIFHRRRLRLSLTWLLWKQTQEIIKTKTDALPLKTNTRLPYSTPLTKFSARETDVFMMLISFSGIVSDGQKKTYNSSIKKFCLGMNRKNIGLAREKHCC